MAVRGRLLIVGLLSANLAMGGVLVNERLVDNPRRAAGSRQFQALVGGLGMGPALELDDCPFSFDPRLAPECGRWCSPLPGGDVYCPHHALSVFYLRPLEGPHRVDVRGID